MADRYNTMMQPPVEKLLDKAGSKFSLVTLASRRARQINTYYNQLGDALGTVVPPQVTSTAHKPLSIAFEEIDADKIEGVGGATGKPVPEALLAATADPASDEDLVEGASAELVGVPSGDDES